MILLGAGASKFFGLKTLQDLTADIVEKMKEIGHEKTILEITDAMKKFGINPDFENIYTTLEALSNPLRGIEKNGGLAAYIAFKSNYNIQQDIKSSKQYEKVLSDLRELIYKECSISRNAIDIIEKTYDHLFQICDQFEYRNLFHITGGDSQARQVDIGQTIVTTNYDVAVELYHRKQERMLANGFKQTSVYSSVLDFTEYGRNPTRNWLIKLHGSIWQFKMDNGRIIQTFSDPENLPFQLSVGEQMMIYPVEEKPILQQPYFTFYTLFRDQPWHTLIAIGYSFRDIPVNIAIMDRLNWRPPPKTKLIVVNPDAENVIRNLPLTKENKEQIIRINEPFRDDAKLFAKIKMAIDCRDWSDFQNRFKEVSKDKS